jgi:hypothetical protein
MTVGLRLTNFDAKKANSPSINPETSPENIPNTIIAALGGMGIAS